MLSSSSVPLEVQSTLLLLLSARPYPVVRREALRLLIVKPVCTAMMCCEVYLAVLGMLPFGGVHVGCILRCSYVRGSR